MVSLENADNALKTVYLGVIANQLNVAANPLLTKIKHSSKDVWGKEIRKLAPIGLNGGVGAGTETGSLPTANGNNYVQFVADLKNLYGRIDISDKAIRASANNVGAFVNLLQDEMEGLVKASTFNLGRMLYGDGTGLLATCSGYTDGFVTVDKVSNIVEGMTIDIYGTSLPIINKARVTYVDRVNNRFTIDKALGSVASGAKVYVQGSRDNEITGLGAIFSDSEYLYGLKRADHKWLSPYSSSTETEVSDVLIQSAIDFLEENADSRINFISCSAKVRRAYQAYLAAYRSNVDVMTLEGGFKAISYNGIPLVTDRFVDGDTMYLLNTDDFTLHELCDWKWLEGEGGRILKQNPNFATYTATLVKYAELICDKPNGQAKISGIKGTVTNPFTVNVECNCPAASGQTGSDGQTE